MQEADIRNSMFQNVNFTENECPQRKPKSLLPISLLSNSHKSRAKLPKSPCHNRYKGKHMVVEGEKVGTLPRNSWLIFWKITINLPNLIWTWSAPPSLSSIINVKFSPSLYGLHVLISLFLWLDNKNHSPSQVHRKLNKAFNKIMVLCGI